MSAALPYTLDNLSGAAARILLAPDTETLPDGPADVTLQVSPYTAQGDWFDVGATSGPCQIGRQLTVAGYSIEQSQTVLLEEPTDVTYTVQVPFAELRPEVLQLINNSGAIETVTGVTGVTGTNAQGAGKRTPFGNMFDLNHFRIAVIVRKSKKQGLVTEPGSITRGRYLTFIGYDCTISAENVQTNMGKGQLASAAVTFKLYPDDDVVTEGEEHGYWFDEDPGTIHAS